MNRVAFAMLVHSHQPVGNFDHVIEETYEKSYRPFIEVIAAHPCIRVSLHYSGVLLEWLEKRHPDFFDRLRELVARGQAEMVGGGFYEPILPAIPDRDKHSQVRRMTEYVERHFGAAPRGAWVAERVWEPGLARVLAEAGVRYVMLDDTHFLAAGLPPSQLHGYYITEDQGFALNLVPSLKTLRYTIPFREPAETLEFLRQGQLRLSAAAPLFGLGDDCEKFGGWPGTFDHVYKNFWLERFLVSLEGASEWLETTTVSDFLDSHPPLGRVYLPTASYSEMMEWALPVEAAQEFQACFKETERLPQAEHIRRFMHGGLWRNFFSKYSESNAMNKLMLEISRRSQAALQGDDPPAAAAAHATARAAPSPVLEAQTELLAGQCNDAYWHGVFGGLYTPHLRAGVQGRLIRAESLLDRAEGRSDSSSIEVRTTDFDVDGADELLVEHPRFGLVIKPGDGATVASLRFKPAAVDLINSLMRRPEAYHDLVRKRPAVSADAAEFESIHDRVLAKEANLGSLLRYDHYARHVFRNYLFPASKTWQDFDGVRLEESGALAGAAWALVENRPGGLEAGFEFRREATIQAGGREALLTATKLIRTEVVERDWLIECRTTLDFKGPLTGQLACGIELVFNLLAPNAPDHYVRVPSAASETRHPLEFKGEIEGGGIELVDEWQGLRIGLSAEPRPRWWLAPIETISQSEAGFERVYQGSAILAVWNVEQRQESVVQVQISQLKRV